MLSERTLNKIEEMSNLIRRLADWEWESPPGQMLSKLMFLRQKLRTVSSYLDRIVGEINAEMSARSLEQITRNIEQNVNVERWSRLALTGLRSITTDEVITPGPVTNEEWVAHARRLLEESASVQQQVHQGRARHIIEDTQQRSGQSVPAENMEIGQQAVETLPEVQSNTDSAVPRVDGRNFLYFGDDGRIYDSYETFQRTQQERSPEEVLHPYGWSRVEP